MSVAQCKQKGAIVLINFIAKFLSSFLDSNNLWLNDKNFDGQLRKKLGQGTHKQQPPNELILILVFICVNYEIITLKSIKIDTNRN